MSTELKVAPPPFCRREGKYSFLGTQVAFACCTTHSAMVFDTTKNFAQYQRVISHLGNGRATYKGIFGNEIPRNN